MGKLSAHELANKVLEMRNAQKQYFALAGKARRTRTTEDNDAKKHILLVSKSLESTVDNAVAVIRNTDPTEKNTVELLGLMIREARTKLYDYFGNYVNEGDLKPAWDLLTKAYDLSQGKGIEQ